MRRRFQQQDEKRLGKSWQLLCTTGKRERFLMQRSVSAPEICEPRNSRERTRSHADTFAQFHKSSLFSCALVFERVA